MRVVVATGNPGKLAEIRHVLADMAVELVAQGELGIPEADEKIGRASCRDRVFSSV